MKKNLFLVMALFAFLFTACDSLWQVNNGASVSFNINLEEILKDSTNPFEIGVDASQPSVIQNLSVFPGSQPGDDFTGDDLTVTVTLHNSQNDAIIANQTLTAAQARNTNVVFDRLTVGQNVYAKIEVLFSAAYNDIRGERDPLFFRARSNSTTLVEGDNNQLQARVNAVFVAPAGMDSTGFTPFNTVSTIEKAVEVLGGVGNFMPDATVYVDGTFDMKDLPQTVEEGIRWHYPGLTITNNSEGSLVRLGEGADIGGYIEFSGITFKGNPNIEADESMFWIVNAGVNFKDVTITGFNGSEEGLAAVRFSPQGWASFEGLVHISENNSNSKPSNVVFELSGNEPYTPLGLFMPLDSASRIYLNPIVSSDAMYPLPLVYSEGGPFFDIHNFVVPGLNLAIDESSGSLFAVEIGTIIFMQGESPLSSIYLQGVKEVLTGSGITWGTDSTAHIATITHEAYVSQNMTLGQYLEETAYQIKYGLGEYGVVETILDGTTLTIQFSPNDGAIDPQPATGTITFLEETKDGNSQPVTESEFPLLKSIFAGMGLTTWNGHILIISEADIASSGAPNIKTYMDGLQVQLSTLASEEGYTADINRTSDTSATATFLAQGRIEFYDITTNTVYSDLSAIKTKLNSFLSTAPQQGNLNWTTGKYQGEGDTEHDYVSIDSGVLSASGFDYMSDYLDSDSFHNGIWGALPWDSEGVVGIYYTERQGYTLRIFLSDTLDLGVIEFYNIDGVTPINDANIWNSADMVIQNLSGSKASLGEYPNNKTVITGDMLQSSGPPTVSDLFSYIERNAMQYFENTNIKTAFIKIDYKDMKILVSTQEVAIGQISFTDALGNPIYDEATIESIKSMLNGPGLAWDTEFFAHTVIVTEEAFASMGATSMSDYLIKMGTYIEGQASVLGYPNTTTNVSLDFQETLTVFLAE